MGQPEISREVSSEVSWGPAGIGADQQGPVAIGVLPDWVDPRGPA